jgi:hypothetical protein
MIEGTNWRRLYGIAALIGAGFGLLLSLGALPFAPEWPGGWGLGDLGPAGRVMVPVLGGALLGVLFAGAAHLGVTCQLRRWSRGGR